MLAACLAKDPAQRPTAERLLDLFAPNSATYSPTAVALQQSAGAVPAHQAPTEAAHPQPQPAQASDAAADGIAFTATDSKGGILIDAGGVSLESDVQSLQFTWGEISTVDYSVESRRFLKVTIRLRDGTTHQHLIKAHRTTRLHEWLEDLPLILECFK
ncbi:hypothetical protein [Streptomyces sp. NPDC055243]|uniref:hypothetical protein n=1 Tax=Streptomyces sp. NPDC055243 TaxID=3365720 RepID=UPI0037D46B5F